MQKSYTTQIKKFGKEIKRRRSEFKITQEDLAAYCDIDVRTVQRIEKGEYGIGLHIVFALSLAFKTTPSELLSCLKV